MSENSHINLDLISHFIGVQQHLMDALHAQQMELIRLRNGRDELSRELLKMQAKRAADSAPAASLRTPDDPLSPHYDPTYGAPGEER